MVVSFIASQGGTQAAPSTLFASTVKEGMLVYDDTNDVLKLCDGTNWVGLQSAETTGAAAGSTEGAVQFRSSAGTFAADDANLVWDDANNRLGIGTASPTDKLTIQDGVVSFNSTGTFGALRFALQDSAATYTNTANEKILLLGATGVGGGDTSFGYKLSWRNSDGSPRITALLFHKDGGVSIGGGSVPASALLDLSSATRGFLPPRMTTAQVTAIASPADGLMVYDTVTATMKLRANGAWVDLMGGAGSETDPQVGLLTATKWCAANAGGTAIDCTADAPATGAAGTGAEVQFRNSTTGAFAANSDFVWDNPNKRLGIGTASPATSLDISSSIPIIRLDHSGTYGAFRFYGSGTGMAAIAEGAGDLVIETGGVGSINEKVRIKSSGNVGIGTTNPAAKLQITTLGAASDLLRFETDRPWRFRSTGTGADSDLQLMSEVDNKNFSIVASDGATRAMEIRATVTGANNRVSLVPDGGNVGIGTTAPRTTLEVNGRTMIEAPSNFWAATNFYGIGGTDRLGQLDTHGAYEVTLTSNGYRTSSGTWESYGANSLSGAAMVALNPAGYIDLRADASKASGSGTGITTRLRITSSGRVGIGTTAPNARLQLGNLVDADPTNMNMIRLWEDTGNSKQFGIGISAGQQNYRADRHVFFTPSSAPIERMRVDLNGNVGIGTTSPQTRLDVNGSLRIGNDAASCTASKEGAIKYVSGASPPYKYCDGTSWTDFSQVGGGGGDTAPTSFVFTDLTGQTFSALISSNTITLAGLDNPPELAVYTTISGQGSPQFRVNGGTWVTSGYVNDGDTVQLRLTSSGSSLTTHSAVLTVGTVSDTWSVTTTSQDNTPNAFAFTDLTGQGLAATISSNTLTISGIGPAPVSVSVSGAGSPQISINGGGWGTTGSISNGQTLRVRQTSANTSSTARSATITVGTVSDNWSVTTATVTAGSQTFSSAGTFTFTVPHHQTLTVKVWGGGGGGAGCSTYSTVAGGNGGSSNWAGSVVANGGARASGSSGGAGGTASGGTTNQTGATGGTSSSNGAAGGSGASGGSGGSSRGSNGNGNNGSAPGGGGGGARFVARGACGGDGGGGGGYATRTYSAGTYSQGSSVTVAVGASGARGNGGTYKGGTGGVGRVTVSWN
ncbi:MAG: hypothetical protein AB7U75_07200 [Hyphomicrobiaceae bacterium]